MATVVDGKLVDDEEVSAVGEHGEAPVVVVEGILLDEEGEPIYQETASEAARGPAAACRGPPGGPPAGFAAPAAAAGPAPENAQFHPGAHVHVVSELVLRAGEDIGSREIGLLGAGERLIVTEVGAPRPGNRVKVATEDLKTEGWVSCRARTGKVLLALASTAAAPPAAGAPAGTPPAATNLTYLCVEPGGHILQAQPGGDAKGGTKLSNGEVVRICERLEQGGQTWLRLADGRGWAVERSKRRCMSEMNYLDASDLPGTSWQIHPLQSPPKLYQSPALGEDKGTLQPGSVIIPTARVTVNLPGPNKKENEERYVIYEVKTEDGGEKSGWLLEASVAMFRTHRPRQAYISVRSSSITVRHYPARVGASQGKLDQGFVMEISEVRTCCGLEFFKLPGTKSKGWVCRTSEKGEDLCAVGMVENHHFMYSCVDPKGATLWSAPTRVAKETGSRLRPKQRFGVTERIVFRTGSGSHGDDDGEVFLQLDPRKKGWVPGPGPAPMGFGSGPPGPVPMVHGPAPWPKHHPAPQPAVMHAHMSYDLQVSVTDARPRLGSMDARPRLGSMEARPRLGSEHMMMPPLPPAGLIGGSPVARGNGGPSFGLMSPSAQRAPMPMGFR